MGVCSYQSNVATRSEVQSRNGNALSIPLDARCGFGPARLAQPVITNHTLLIEESSGRSKIGPHAPREVDRLRRSGLVSRLAIQQCI